MMGAGLVPIQREAKTLPDLFCNQSVVSGNWGLCLTGDQEHYGKTFV